MKGRIRILRDEDPQNPRQKCENLGALALFHRKYRLGDETHGIDHDAFNSWAEMEAYIRGELDAAVVLPVYMYDHNGITINTTGFSCPWDSGQIGFVFITKVKARAEYGCKRISKKLLRRLETYLAAEVKTYDDYLTGNVYGYVVEELPDGADEESGWSHVDSCWGFYGDDPKENGMESYIEEYVEKGYEVIRE